jgi:hypothetical protein
MSLLFCQEECMAAIQPPVPRYRIEDDFTTLRITIPARRNWPIILFLGVWLMGWAVGEVFVGATLFGGLYAVLTGQPQAADALGGQSGGLFMIVWLTLWTAGGGFALFTWLWNVAGKEIAFVDGDSLTIKKAVLGVGRSRRYAAAYVDRLRASGTQGDTQVPWTGGLTFDYGGSTVQFGAGLNQAEARQVLERIADRFPSLTRGVEE